MGEKDLDDLKRRVGEVMAYMCDYLIEPAAEAYPDLNPYASDNRPTHQ